MSSSIHGDYASPTPPSGNGAVSDMTEVLVARLHEAIDIKGHFHGEAIRYKRAMDASKALVRRLRDNCPNSRPERLEALVEVLEILDGEASRAN